MLEPQENNSKNNEKENEPQKKQINYNFNQITFLQSLDPLEQKIYNIIRNNLFNLNFYFCSCGPQGIKGKINFFLLISIISLIFSICTIITSFNSCSEYEELKKLLSSKIDEMNKMEIKVSSYDIKALWRDLKKIQNCIFIINLIIICFFIAFVIIQKVYCTTIVETEKKQGKITTIMILINYIFSFCFRILFIVDFYFYIYEILVVLNKPLNFGIAGSGYEKSEEEKNYDKIYEKSRLFGILNFSFLICLHITIFILCWVNRIIYIYLDLNFEDNDNSNNIIQANDTNQNYYTTINAINSVNNYKSRNNMMNIPINTNTKASSNKDEKDRIKVISINVNDKKIDILIKTNKNLYLQEINSKIIYTFKQIVLKNITNDYVYINVKNDIIKNILSISDLEYPKLDKIYLDLDTTYLVTFFACFFISPSIFLHANDEPLYFELKEEFKMKEYSDISNIDIYNYYGNYEKGVTESEFYLYLFSFIIIYLLMIKRAIYRNKFESYMPFISFFLSIVFLVINMIYNILNILLIIFSFLANSAVSEYSRRYKEKFRTEAKIKSLNFIFVVQACLSLLVFFDLLKLLYFSMQLFHFTLYENKNSFSSNEKESSNEESLSEIKFMGLDQIQHSLYEYQIEGHPRYLYYILKSSEKNNNLISVNNKTDNILTKNSIDELIEPNKNDIEVMKITKKKNKRALKNKK